MEPNDIQKARALLAFAGANLSSIDKSFNGEAYYGDRTGYRQTANSVEAADLSIQRRMKPSYTPEPIFYNQQFPEPQTIQPSQVSYQPMHSTPKISREERINKLLGKSAPEQQMPVVVQTDEYVQTVNAVKEALEPVTEQLEDIAVLIGIMVQRLEQLIKIVDSDAVSQEEPVGMVNEVMAESQPFHLDYLENDEPMEVYDPEVSMSVLDDEENTVQEAPKKKRKKN